MQLKCPNCGQAIPARQINVQKLIAVCDQCDAVFNVDAGALPTPGRKRRKVPQPERFQVVEEGDRLEMHYFFREHMGWLEYIVGGIFAAMALAGVVGLGVLLASGMLLYTLPLLAGIGVLVYLLASIVVNEAELKLDETTLAYKEGPLFTFSDKAMDRGEVVRVYAKPSGLTDNPADDYYNVMVQMPDGLEKALVQYTRRDIAAYMAQVIEEYLNADAEALESPFVDADEVERDSVPAEGEVMAAPDADDAALSLEDLLREEEDSQRRSSL